jgi:CheY-like chemotaxis protein
MSEGKLHLLLIEDDQVDTEAIVRGVLRHNLDTPVFRVPDGEAALEALRGDGLPRVPEPRLVLLDLNLPRMNGFEFLKALREDASISHTPVVVITTSDEERDVREAYKHNVCAYFLKSESGDDFEHLATLLKTFRDHVVLPIKESDRSFRDNALRSA